MSTGQRLAWLFKESADFDFPWSCRNFSLCEEVTGLLDPLSSAGGADTFVLDRERDGVIREAGMCSLRAHGDEGNVVCVVRLVVSCPRSNLMTSLRLR